MIEPWMNLAALRRFFARMKGLPLVDGRKEPMVGIPYIVSATKKGLPFHRDPVTGRRYWLMSEVSAFLERNNAETTNAPLRRRKAS